MGFEPMNNGFMAHFAKNTTNRRTRLGEGKQKKTAISNEKRGFLDKNHQWAGLDSNQRRLTPMGLQPIPFSHSGTDPFGKISSLHIKTGISNKKPIGRNNFCMEIDINRERHCKEYLDLILLGRNVRNFGNLEVIDRLDLYFGDRKAEAASIAWLTAAVEFSTVHFD